MVGVRRGSRCGGNGVGGVVVVVVVVVVVLLGMALLLVVAGVRVRVGRVIMARLIVRERGHGSRRRRHAVGLPFVRNDERGLKRGSRRRERGRRND